MSLADLCGISFLPISPEGKGEKRKDGKERRIESKGKPPSLVTRGFREGEKKKKGKKGIGGHPTEEHSPVYYTNEIKGERKKRKSQHL